MTDPKKHFAARLKELRLELGFSQEELAERSNLHRTYISLIERAQRNVTLENICKLAKALKVHPSELLSKSVHSKNIDK